MTLNTETAMKFFEACEAGKGWEGCKPYCTANATFSSQAEPIADLTTLEQYADWMRAICQMMPDARYELKSFGTDPERGNITAFAIFSGTHTGEGGPIPPTGKSMKADYVYYMELEGDKVSHLTKIWHSGISMKELGWA